MQRSYNRRSYVTQYGIDEFREIDIFGGDAMPGVESIQVNIDRIVLVTPDWMMVPLFDPFDTGLHEMHCGAKIAELDYLLEAVLVS